MNFKKPVELLFEQILVGPMSNITYLIGDAKTSEVMIVDIGWEVDKVDKIIQKNKFKVVGLIFTHSHFDHIGGMADMLKRYDVPVYFSEAEAKFFKLENKNIRLLKDGDCADIGAIHLECILTPGHTPGCMCFKYKNILLTGDTLFIDGCGRCDLPGGDPAKVYQSLYNKLMKLPDDTVIFCGHASGIEDCDTLGHQKITNPYLQAASLEDFLGQ